MKLDTNWRITICHTSSSKSSLFEISRFDILTKLQQESSNENQRFILLTMNDFPNAHHTHSIMENFSYINLSRSYKSDEVSEYDTWCYTFQELLRIMTIIIYMHMWKYQTKWDSETFSDGSKLLTDSVSPSISITYILDEKIMENSHIWVIHWKSLSLKKLICIS